MRRNVADGVLLVVALPLALPLLPGLLWQALGAALDRAGRLAMRRLR